MAANAKKRLYVRDLYAIDRRQLDQQCGPFLVLAVQRYLFDATFKRRVNCSYDYSQPKDVIQLTLADETEKLKVILDPTLNKQIQTNQIHAGCRVNVIYGHCVSEETGQSGQSGNIPRQSGNITSQSGNITGQSGNITSQSGNITGQSGNITSLSGNITCQSGNITSQPGNIAGQPGNITRQPGYITVKHLTVVSTDSDFHDRDFSHLCWTEDRFESDEPNPSARGYYLNVWSTFQPIGNIWKTNRRQTSLNGELLGGVIELKELDLNYCKYPHVLVKVLVKSCLLHYGKPDKEDKWPFQAHLLVGDGSGVCTMVLWQKVCPNWYYRLSAGDILLLRRFVRKRQYQPYAPYLLDKAARGRTMFNFDLNINSDNPTAEVTVIDPKSLPDTVDLPPVNYRLVSRRVAGLLPKDQVVDIAGVVTYVGRMERKKAETREGQDSGSYWIKQWVHLMDDSTPHPFVVELYHSSLGPDVELQPGSLILITNTRLHCTQSRPRTSRSNCHMWLTTTKGSEVKRLDNEVPSSLEGSPEISRLVRWSHTDLCRTVVENCKVGGYCPGIPLPTTSKEVFTTMENSFPIPSIEWLDVFKSLRFRERRQVAVYANLVSVKYNPIQNLRQLKRQKLDYTVDIAPIEDEDSLDRVGSQNLDSDLSFHAPYTERLWPALKQRLGLPAVDLESATFQDPGAIETSMEPYFTFVWRGFNKRTLLHTHMVYPYPIHKHSSFSDILSGGEHLNPNIKHPTTSVNILKMLTEAKTLYHQKNMHVVLDCCRCSSSDIELMVKRAFTVDSISN